MNQNVMERCMFIVPISDSMRAEPPVTCDNHGTIIPHIISFYRKKELRDASRYDRVKKINY